MNKKTTTEKNSFFKIKTQTLFLLTLFTFLSCKSDKVESLKIEKLTDELENIHFTFKKIQSKNDSLNFVINNLENQLDSVLSENSKMENLLGLNPINKKQQIDFTDINILKIINQFGPLSFLRKNQIWYFKVIKQIDNKFYLSQIPLMKVYGNNLNYKETNKLITESGYLLDLKNPQVLNDIFDVNGSWDNYKPKNNIYLTNDRLEIKKPSVYIRGVIVNNTTRKINGIKVNLKIYDGFGSESKLIKSKEVYIYSELLPKQLKTIIHQEVISFGSKTKGFWGYEIEFLGPI